MDQTELEKRIARVERALTALILALGDTADKHADMRRLVDRDADVYRLVSGEKP